MNWYYDLEGRSQGPLSENSLKRLAREGTIGGDTLVWHAGIEEWKPLLELKPELSGKIADQGNVLPPAERRNTGVPPSPPPAQKNSGVLKRIFGWGKKK